MPAAPHKAAKNAARKQAKVYDMASNIKLQRQKKNHILDWIKIKKKPQNDHHKGFARGHPPYY